MQGAEIEKVHLRWLLYVGEANYRSGVRRPLHANKNIAVVRSNIQSVGEDKNKRMAVRGRLSEEEEGPPSLREWGEEVVQNQSSQKLQV